MWVFTEVSFRAALMALVMSYGCFNKNNKRLRTQGQENWLNPPLTG